MEGKKTYNSIREVLEAFFPNAVKLSISGRRDVSMIGSETDLLLDSKDRNESDDKL